MGNMFEGGYNGERIVLVGYIIFTIYKVYETNDFANGKAVTYSLVILTTG
jgi:hypothetical protein